MGKNQTSFKVGHKGMGGRPKGQTARSAFNALLSQVDPALPDETRFQTAARLLWEEAKRSPDFLLNTLKWSEGSSPQESQTAGEAEASKQVGEFLHGKDRKAAATRQARRAGERVPGQGGEAKGVQGSS